MTRRRVFVALGAILLVAAVSLISWVHGFFFGATYTLTREAQTDAGITAAVLVRLQHRRYDEATGLLERRLAGDFVTHWGGFSFEDATPQVWVFKHLNLGGLAFAASYLAEHPDPKRGHLVDEIVACYRRRGLPDPRRAVVAYREAIKSCYATLR